MSDRIWTSAQSEAIAYRGKNLLVSAAAGSGKTATLTERIIRLITDKEVRADISRMLVVTFTKAAAAELRDRVAKALGDAAAKDPGNTHLTDQLCRVGDAMICTMDSFFMSCVRPMFSEVGLPADFRIGDTAEICAMREEAMADTVDYFFDSGDAELERTISVIAGAVGSARTEEGIDGVLLEFDAEAERTCIGAEELFAYAENLLSMRECDILETPFGECILAQLRSGLAHFGNMARTLGDIMAENEVLSVKYVPAAYTMADYCDRCLALTDRGDVTKLRGLLREVPAPYISTKVPTNESERFKALRGEFKEFIGTIYGGYLSDSPDICKDVFDRTAEICRCAGVVIGEFRRRYSEMKRRRGITDHADVTRMAAKLLATDEGTPTPYGESISSGYDYVFIDEYQDTSIYQDRIFAAVASKCGRFMVGDIKQSIYRFRGGEPAVFKGYRELWEDGVLGSTVFMSENFRCAEPVVQLVNTVSRYMFPHGQIPFAEDDLLVHGRHEIEGSDASPAEICLIERPSRQRSRDSEDEPAEIIPSGAEIEADYVARRIRHMLDCEYLPDGRRIMPEDIAVMLRDIKSRKEIISDVFARYGIPLKNTEKRPLFEQAEIMLLICILKALDNPMSDIYLAGSMRSAVFGFSMGDIAFIKNYFRQSGDKGNLWDGVRYAAESAEEGEIFDKCRKFVRRLGEFRALACTLTAAPFVYRLIHDPSVVYAIETEGGPGGMGRAMRFYELARTHDTGLYDFLDYLEYVERSGTEDIEVGGTEGVSLITVHHSKGLEFPVCFLMNATKKYNKNDAKKIMLLDRTFGVAVKLPDDDGLVRCDNHLRRLAVFRGLRENSFEEMRILYVAMTRARERLIITGVTNSPEKLLGAAAENAKFYDEYSVLSKNSYMDMILEAMHLYGGDFASVVRVPYGSEEVISSAPAEDEKAVKTDSYNADELKRELSERLDFEYGYKHLRNIPSKLTVSKLYPQILDEYDDGAAELVNEEIVEVSVPKFMSGTAYSPADAGSAAHVFMQFCDFEKLCDLGVGAELCRLVDEGFMSRAEGEAANRDYLEKFRRSDFFRRILSAKEVRREFRFNAAVDAASLTGDEEKSALLKKDEADVIVQGVMDIVFTDEDGRLVLADYKTDRLTDYELNHISAASKKLWNRHGNQLGYYAKVCEKLFGKAPDEVVIYSMPLGETV